MRIIRWLSARGILAGTPETAALPALTAATTPDAAGRFYGPNGPGHTSGAPAEQKLFSRFRDEENARRIWQVSEELTGTAFTTA